MGNVVDALGNPTLYKKELFKAFRRIFSGTIKESFLIEMIKCVEDDPRYSIIFLGNNNPDELFSMDHIALGKGNNSADICKMIVMNHYVNTVFMTDYERGNQQSSKLYKNKLVEDVIKMFRIERLVVPDFSTASLEAFLPIIYYVTALNNYLGGKYDEIINGRIMAKQPYNTDFNYKILFKLFTKIKACVSLADIRANDELMVVYRTLIELFMTYAALWDKDESTINSFYEFDQATFDYNYDGVIPEHMKLMAKDMGVNEVRFINYGWIKNLDEFKNLPNKPKAISMGGLAKILDKKCGYFCAGFGTELHKFYKACNPQTHGTMLIMNYYQLELHIFQNIAVMLKFITKIMTSNLFDFDVKYGNVDLIDELNNVLNDSRKVYDWLNSDQKNLDKTNVDYRNRAICSIKMK